jgi:group I intron endonuclease
MNSKNNPINDQNVIMKETNGRSSKNACCGIYGLRNKITGKWYIGQSIDISDRFKSYRLLKTKKQPKLHNSLLKYGYDNFEKVIIEKCDEVQWVLDYREVFWIKQLNTIQHGYNIREGGSGGRLADSTKEKLRQINLGKKMSSETLLKMRNRPKHTDEARKKMSEARKGKKCSEETKQKMREAQLESWTKKRTPPDSNSVAHFL